MAKKLNLDAELGRTLVQLREEIIQRDSDWAVIGLLTESTELIENHPRLLRSKYFSDEDYPQQVMAVLLQIVEKDVKNVAIIQQFLQVAGQSLPRQITITPRVFDIPNDPPDRNLVAVMMPFDAGMRPVYEAIQGAVADVPLTSLTCQRVDNMWEHSTVIQDVFSLIFRSFIVVCDFTNRNPNVFYEAGIAHTLGKHVVPITQSGEDMPFDLRHHRYLHYLGNAEGLAALRKGLTERLTTLVQQP